MFVTGAAGVMGAHPVQACRGAQPGLVLRRVSFQAGQRGAASTMLRWKRSPQQMDGPRAPACVP